MLVQCAVCGASNEVALASNPQPASPPDFDTRPGEPLRSTMRSWVNQCLRCGYAADDISVAQSNASEIVGSDAFQQILEDPLLSEAAIPFYSYSLLLEKCRQLADAGWAALHAAWACDDANQDEGAAKCRARAIRMWRRGKEFGEAFGDDLASEFALVTDVCRRLGQFEEATVACSEGLELEDAPPALEYLLRRQIVLIQQRDVNRHSMTELLTSASVN